MSGVDSDTSIIDDSPAQSSGTDPNPQAAGPPPAFDNQPRYQMPDPYDFLMGAVQTMAQNQIELQHLFHQIGQQQAHAGSTIGSTTTRPSGTIRVKEPRVFDGRAEELQPFLDEVRTSLHLQRNHFATDYDKALFFALYLKAPGAPSSWFKAVEKVKPHLLQDYDALVEDFRKHFDDPDLKNTKQRELADLKQHNMTTAEYSSRFYEKLAYLDMTEESKCIAFRNGLRPSVLKAIMIGQDIPPTLDEFSDLAIRVDNRLTLANIELNSRNGSSKSSKPSASRQPSNAYTERSTYAQTLSAPAFIPAPAPVASADTSGVVPMEIDAVKRGPLTAEERKRRQDLGLCRYCGASGHELKSCPLKPSKPYVARAAASSSSSPPRKGKAKPGSR